MALKVTGIGERYGLPGLTVVLALLALWLGTRHPDSFGDVKNPVLQHLIAIVIVAMAFYIGSENPDLFGGILGNKVVA
jgi:hypothetical protein